MYNPYYWTDELIPYGNNGSLDPEFWTKYLLGGWTNPEKYACQIGSFPPNWWVKINNLLKPPKLESLKKTITSCAAGAPPGRLLGEEEVQFEKDYLHLRIPRCEHLDFPVSPKFVANPQCLFHNRATVSAREVVGKGGKIYESWQNMCSYGDLLGNLTSAKKEKYSILLQNHRFLVKSGILTCSEALRYKMIP